MFFARSVLFDGFLLVIPCIAMASLTSQDQDSVRDAEKGPTRVLTASPTQFTDSEDEPATNGHTSIPRAGSDPEGTDEGESYEGSDGEGEEDADEDDDEDDDEEPALKYERIGGSIPDLFRKDSASSLAVANKLMVSTIYALIFVD